jgi:hypothetical protein
MPSVGACQHPTWFLHCLLLKSRVWVWPATEATNQHRTFDFARMQIRILVIHQHKPAFIPRASRTSEETCRPLDDHRQWVFLRMRAAYFLLNAKPSNVRLSAAGTPEEALVLEWLASEGARLATPCLCSARRKNMSLLYPKVEHVLALPVSGTRTQSRPDVPRPPEGEPGLSGGSRMQDRLLSTGWSSRRKASSSQATSPATTAQPEPSALPKEFEGNQPNRCTR